LAKEYSATFDSEVAETLHNMALCYSLAKEYKSEKSRVSNALKIYEKDMAANSLCLIRYEVAYSLLMQLKKITSSTGSDCRVERNVPLTQPFEKGAVVRRLIALKTQINVDEGSAC